MSSIFLMTLIIFAVFAVMFALCEWVVRRATGGDGGSLTSPRFSDSDRPRDEAPTLAARRRVSQQLERDGGHGADAE
jgi:hypothetical protein